MVSRRDIAFRAGVSQATVTNVFNKSKYVSEDVRRKVLATAEEIGYQNTLPTEFVLIVNDAANPHHGMILRGMKETAEKYGAFASMILLDNDADLICRRMIERRVSGVFLGTTEHEIDDRHCKLFKKSGIGFSSSWDDFNIEFGDVYMQTIEYLSQLGHSRIAYLGGIKLDMRTNIRYASFCGALDACGLQLISDLTVNGVLPYKTDMASGYWAMKELLNRKQDFTAVLTLNDLMAIGAVRALNEVGFSVPDDVSVVGCDNIPQAEYAAPTLTTLDIPAREIGRQIIYNLLQKAKGDEATKIRICPELLIRKSTGLARSSSL